MDLTKIFEMQKELDKAILTKHNIKQEDVELERVVALLVEISEFANEYAPFKYWKKNIKVVKEKLIEEFVDGIHFFASISLTHGINPIINAKIISQNQNQQLGATYESVAKIITHPTKRNIKEAFAIYLGNAKLLNMSDEEIVNSYISKNEVNYQRLQNGY